MFTYVNLAKLYGIETKQLNRQVQRNFKRFPPDFMFQLCKFEEESLRYQFGTSKEGMRIFTKLRSFHALESNLAAELQNFKENVSGLFKVVFTRLDGIEDDLTPKLPKQRKKIGIKVES